MTWVEEISLAHVHLVATGFMVGLIWFVQVVHYPLLGRMAATDLVAYEREHVSRTFRLVAPVMIVEAATAIALAIDPGGPLPLAGLVLLVAIWLVTATVQVPLHRRISVKPSRRTVATLVRSNWVRTLAWSARGGLCKNPYALNRNPCGSSSGSGAGVSANFAHAAASCAVNLTRSPRAR